MSDPLGRGVAHTDVAAYTLGLLESDERLEFEAHLGDCESCAAEFAEFSGMADLLTGVEPVESDPVEPDEAAVVSLISRRATARRHRVRQWLVLAAVASLVILAGGAAAGVAFAPGQAPPAAQGVLYSATSKLTGAAATVGLVTKPWGTVITLDLSGVRGPLDCQLIGVSKTGQRAVAMSWRVPATGYGTPWHPAHLVIVGGTAIMLKDLARVQVDVAGGRTLVSIPI